VIECFQTVHLRPSHFCFFVFRLRPVARFNGYRWSYPAPGLAFRRGGRWQAPAGNPHAAAAMIHAASLEYWITAVPAAGVDFPAPLPPLANRVKL